MLSARSLTKSFLSANGPVTVLRDVSLDVARGETVALTGESGSGKSTLLHLLACLDTPDSGTILLDGSPTHTLSESGRAALRRTRIGVVFQQFNLIPSLTVARNLDFQARLAGRLDTAWQAELTARLGLDGLGSRYPEELSGGQQQRVAIGRAVAVRPDLLLADEPTGNLDEDSADRVLSLLESLASDTGAALLMVTHSERLAARMARRLHLSRGQIA